MQDALTGTLVVELGTMVTAPLAGMMLADMGARVIKVELPGTGDPFRGQGKARYSAPFVAYNRNKESIQLDLREDAGRADLARLLEHADIVLENFRPGVFERLGFDAKRLGEINPGLIRASITGFGATGPYQARPAFDSVPLAMSGLYSLMLDKDDPRMTGPTIADNITGMYAAQGILAALLRRSRTGKGGHVEVNMLEAAISFVPDAFAQFSRSNIVADPETRVRISQSYTFVCADKQMLSIHFSSVPKFWESLLETIGRPELAQDERFVTPAQRTAHYHELRAILADAFAARTRAEWVEALVEAGVPAAPVLRIDEVAQDSQVEALGTFVPSSHPQMGQIVNIKSPVTCDGMRRESFAPPPVLGEHSAAIAREFGLTSL